MKTTLKLASLIAILAIYSSFMSTSYAKVSTHKTMKCTCVTYYGGVAYMSSPHGYHCGTNARLVCYSNCLHTTYSELSGGAILATGGGIPNDTIWNGI